MLRIFILLLIIEKFTKILTTSSIYVKDLDCSPLPNNFNCLPSTTQWINLSTDISGLPKGPYTVKNLKPIDLVL